MSRQATSLARVSPSLLFTAEAMDRKYGPTMNLDDLASVLGVKARTIIQNISKEVFPIPVVKIGSKWTALSYDVAEYLDNNKVHFN